MAEAKKAKETAAPVADLSVDEIREQLKAELMAELKAELKTNPGQTAAPVADPSLEEYVEIQLFKDGKDYKDDVFVSVNGENCLIRRGIPVKIKRKFALILEQSQRQDVIAAEYAEKKQREYKEQAATYSL